MGYNSGRTGDETKTLLNKADNHALYKGTVTLNNDVPQIITEGAVIVGAAGSNCEVTDIVSNTSLWGKQCVVQVGSTGATSLVELSIPSGNYVTTDNTQQTITGVKAFINGISFASSLGPGTTGIMRDGNAGVKISGMYIDLTNTMGVVTHTLVYNNTDTHGLAVPNTASWSASKTIATTEDCGTKLYKHELIKSNDSLMAIFISWDPTPLTSSGTGQDILNLYDNSVKACRDTGALMLKAYLSSNTFYYIAVTNEGTPSTYTIASASIDHDTVTPL